MTAPSPRFGRTPRGVYLIAGLLGTAAVLATFASVVPWYVDNGTFPIDGGYLVYSQYFTPGPGGYTHACSTYVSAHATVCVSFSYDYSGGSGTVSISTLYYGLLGTSVATALLAFAGAMTISAGLQGRVRPRMTRTLVIAFVAAALCAAAASTILLPTAQGPAYAGFSGCPGFNGTASPCDSFVGQVNCLGVSTPCSATNGSNFSWYPQTGWYLAIASAGVLAAGLVLLHFQPLAAPCPFCGTLNRFPARYCITCSRPLPADKLKNSVGYRL